MDFNSADTNFYGSHPPSLTPASYVDISGSPLQTLLDPTEDSTRNLADLNTDLRGFDQYQNSRNLRYNGTQQ
jgi:hypothetical protein